MGSSHLLFALLILQFLSLNDHFLGYVKAKIEPLFFKVIFGKNQFLFSVSPVDPWVSFRFAKCKFMCINGWIIHFSAIESHQISSEKALKPAFNLHLCIKIILLL